MMKASESKSHRMTSKNWSIKRPKYDEKEKENRVGR